MKLTIDHDRQSTDPRLHLAIEPQARTIVSAQLSLPYLGGLALTLRRTHAAEADGGALTPPEEPSPRPKSRAGDS
jgi:hypothetical protein